MTYVAGLLVEAGPDGAASRWPRLAYRPDCPHTLFMSKKIFPIILIIVGILIIVQGTRREDSVVGMADSVGTSVANTWDGEARQPEHIWYYVGGGVLILAGLFGSVRRKAS